MSKTTEWRKKNPEKAKALRIRENDKRRGNRAEENSKRKKRINDSPKLLAYQRKYQREFKRRNYRHYKKTRQDLKANLVEYDLTLEQYDTLLMQQNNCCAICHTTDWGRRRSGPIRPSVDHCHKTNKVRGLLCTNCNNGLGRFKDDPEIFARAIVYLGGSKQ